MREYNIDKNLLNNIEISDEMKQDLISDVKQGKRTSNRKFRYSTGLMAACIVGVVAFSGAGASAAYLSYKNRVENMPKQEKEEYVQKLENDTYNSLEESMTRSFTKEENDRLIKLQNDYYKNGVFPKENMPHLKSLSELEPDMLAYVEEDNMIHVPESELTDEQILQYVDHMAKYIYTIEENNKQEASEEQVQADEAEGSDTIDEELYDKTVFDVSEEDEEAFRKQSWDLIKDFYGEDGEDLDDTWMFDVSGFQPSELDGMDDIWDGYNINWIESEAPNSKMYQIVIPKNEDGVFSISKSGLEVFNDAEEYSWDEAKQYTAQGEETVKQFVKEKFGLGEPDRIEYSGFENLEGTPIKSEIMTFNLYYGEHYVAVDWLISKDKVNGIIGSGLIELNKDE